MSPTNPRKWRFTWEAQSHSPTLRLFLFDSHTNPSLQCQNLKITQIVSKSQLLVTWTHHQDDAVLPQQVSLRVPIPRALVDSESPISVNSLSDHIEVKLALLLPVDHPMVSVLGSSDDSEFVADSSVTFSMDSDFKSLSSMDGVHFYCRSCSKKLTTIPIRHFVELPSVNWREVADNWFGNCCCSFGGVSEKLVSRFANSYTCAEGICLLTSTTITLHKNDLLECEFPVQSGTRKYLRKPHFSDAAINSGNHHHSVLRDDDESERLPEETNGNATICASLVSDLLLENVASVPKCCVHTTDDVQNQFEELYLRDAYETSPMVQRATKSFLNGFLGNIFMARSSNLSRNIEWIECVCPRCSFLLGAHPCGSGDASVDGGARLFKCCVSTSLPVGGSCDLFRKYTLEKMFTTQLLESAKDELSFRTVVRDLITKSPMLQIVILNSNSWCCTGYCLGTEGSIESTSKLDLYPVTKVLFSDCSGNTECQLRVLEDWVAKTLADEVFMLSGQIEELIESLTSAKDILPPSCTSLDGLSLSSMQR
ncbi:DUF2351 domain-containing protein [Cephalotus follicularis]|uniref:DUF2351 domain-containing protein n=1 Tax=Cephalotus follicularis TaxID=3775 RepID=A0A1Q3BBU7_CEPFO|nr:DUF2351 domain-containing protein [Cephalotus follicularis]